MSDEANSSCTMSDEADSCLNMSDEVDSIYGEPYSEPGPMTGEERETLLINALYVLMSRSQERLDLDELADIFPGRGYIDIQQELDGMFREYLTIGLDAINSMAHEARARARACASENIQLLLEERLDEMLIDSAGITRNELVSYANVALTESQQLDEDDVDFDEHISDDDYEASLEDDEDETSASRSPYDPYE